MPAASGDRGHRPHGLGAHPPYSDRRCPVLWGKRADVRGAEARAMAQPGSDQGSAGRSLDRRRGRIGDRMSASLIDQIKEAYVSRTGLDILGSAVHGKDLRAEWVTQPNYYYWDFAVWQVVRP